MLTVVENEAVARDAGVGKFRALLEEIRVVDCHDHILPRERVLESGDVLFHLFASSYLPGGIAAVEAGLAEEPFDSAKSWEVFDRHLPRTSNTSAYRSLAAALKALYDCDGIPRDADSYHQLREKMEDAYGREDWYHHVLREKANVDVVILAEQDDEAAKQADAELFLPTANLDAWVHAYRDDYRQRLEKRFHMKVVEFRDFIDLMDDAFAEFSDEGVSAVWLSHNRFRHLHVANVEYKLASSVFGKRESEVSAGEATHFQDFVIHSIADRCAAFGIPLQVDTGLHHDAISIDRSDPARLATLISQHPKTRFVLLHAGYPFARHPSIQAKTFPNVYIDASALPWHSFSLTKEVLGEWLELVPVAKMLLWGGNSRRIEASVGSLMMMREALSELLSERVANGFFSEELAIDVARMLLRDIPRRFYRTEEMRVRRKGSG